MMKAIAVGGKSVSASRAYYICYNDVTDIEKSLDENLESEFETTGQTEKGRRLFNEQNETLTRRAAEKFLGGANEKIADGDLFEFVLSLKEGEFEKLGSTLAEQAKNLRAGMREGMKDLSDLLKVKNVKWVAGLHLNTNNPHLHILVNKDVLTLSGQPTKLKTIPLSWMLQRQGASSQVAAIFEQAWDGYVGNILPKVDSP